MQGRGWQSYVAYLTEQSRKDSAARRHEAVGRVLYAVIFSVLLTFAVGMLMKYMRWL